MGLCNTCWKYLELPSLLHYTGTVPSTCGYTITKLHQDAREPVECDCGCNLQGIAGFHIVLEQWTALFCKQSYGS